MVWQGKNGFVCSNGLLHVEFLVDTKLKHESHDWEIPN